MKRVQFDPSPVTWINHFVLRSRRLKFAPFVILGVIYFLVVLAVVAGAVEVWREPRNGAAELEQVRGLQNIQPSEIRIRNGSDLALADVIVGGRNYGNIGPPCHYGVSNLEGGLSLCRRFTPGWLKRPQLAPNRPRGRRPLGEGRFTYVLTPMKAAVESDYLGEVPSGNTRLTYVTAFNSVAIDLVKDDPTGVSPSTKPGQQSLPALTPPNVSR